MVWYTFFSRLCPFVFLSFSHNSYTRRHCQPTHAIVNSYDFDFIRCHPTCLHANAPFISLYIFVDSFEIFVLCNSDNNNFDMIQIQTPVHVFRSNMKKSIKFRHERTNEIYNSICLPIIGAHRHTHTHTKRDGERSQIWPF